MQKLTETIDSEYTLSEAKEGGLRLRVPFMVADVVGKNNRKYPREVLAQSVEDLKRRVTRRSAFGSSSHPKDTLEVPDVSHIIESAEMQGHAAYAVIHVLDTKKGHDVIQILKAGGRLGISARGFGETKTEGQVDIVQPGYRLDGFDFTLSPALPLHADKGNFILESAPLDADDQPKAPGLESFSSDVQRLAEAIVRKRLEWQFREAVASGFSGDFDSFRAMKEGNQETPISESASEKCLADGEPILDERQHKLYLEALESDYKGSPSEFLATLGE